MCCVGGLLVTVFLITLVLCVWVVIVGFGLLCCCFFVFGRLFVLTFCVVRYCVVLPGCFCFVVTW